MANESNDPLMDALGSTGAAQGASSAGKASDATAQAATEQPDAKPITPGELHEQTTDPNGKPMDLEFLLDIPLQVRVEVGRTRMQISELLALGAGSIVELNKLLGEPFEVLVNDKLVARGEVVIVNDRFGVRLTDIVSPNERVQSLA